MISEQFQKELTDLINRHSIENIFNMPDFIIAAMLCDMIQAMGKHIKHNLDWHGCESVWHCLHSDEVREKEKEEENEREKLV